LAGLSLLDRFFSHARESRRVFIVQLHSGACAEKETPMQYQFISRRNEVLFVLVIAVGMVVGGMARAALTLVGPLNLSHSGNLVQNGSFEDHPNSGASIYYWATGTSSTPFAQPANWVTNGASLNYAEWGNTALFEGSAPLPDGTSGLYFGNGLMASISETPTFNADGSVTFISPTPSIVPKFSPPVTLSQTLTGLNTSAMYGLSFWTSGEDAATSGFAHDGFFGLDVTGYSTVYLAAPSGTSGLGTSHVYNFLFTPASPNTTITFTNWGHPVQSMPGWTLPTSTELILDDVIVNQIPEPNAVRLVGLGALGALRYGGRRRRRGGKKVEG
jgi:hypothetical protein